MLAFLTLDIVAAHNAVAWPTVVGEVLSSEAQEGCGKGESYFPSVRYRYVVQSKEYEGRRIAFGNCGCGSEGEAAAIASEYPQGSLVIVHFNAWSPSEAVLLVGDVLDETWIGIALTVVVAVASFGLAYVGIKQGAFAASTARSRSSSSNGPME